MLPKLLSTLWRMPGLSGNLKCSFMLITINWKPISTSTALDELMDQGHVFSTIDESHFSASAWCAPFHFRLLLMLSSIASSPHNVLYYHFRRSLCYHVHKRTELILPNSDAEVMKWAPPLVTASNNERVPDVDCGILVWSRDKSLVRFGTELHLQLE